MYIERIYVDVNMSTDACFVLLMVIVVQRYAFFLKTPNLPFVFFDRGKTGRYKYCELEVNRL